MLLLLLAAADRTDLPQAKSRLVSNWAGLFVGGLGEGVRDVDQHWDGFHGSSLPRVVGRWRWVTDVRTRNGPSFLDLIAEDAIPDGSGVDRWGP